MKKVIAFISKVIHSNPSKNPNNKSNPTDEDLREIQDLHSAIEVNLNEIQNLSDQQKQNLDIDIKEMITYYNKMTDQIEGRRQKLVDSSEKTITIIIAASGLLIALRLPFIWLFPILIVFVIQLIYAIVKVIEYQAQSSFKYPFNNSSYGNCWKWFYYGNPSIVKITPDPFKSKSKNQKDLLSYLGGFNYFLMNYRSETSDQEIRNNLQQLYLLQVHNFYKNKFFLRLNRYDILANRLTILFLIIYLGVVLGIFINILL